MASNKLGFLGADFVDQILKEVRNLLRERIKITIKYIFISLYLKGGVFYFYVIMFIFKLLSM